MKIAVPIPTSSIGTVNEETGRIDMAREWYRFFGLLYAAVGGDTNGLDASINAGGEVPGILALVSDLQRRVADLEAQQRTSEPVPYQAIADLQVLTLGPSA